MPKKQNGFGNPKSLSFKGVESKVSKGKGRGAAGFYPSNRQFGSSVQKTIIEKYDYDSNWTRWRKGFEYYNQGAFLEFTEFETLLYQGTPDETQVRFSGQRYATKNADSNTHYTVKREILDDITLGSINRVFSNIEDNKEYYDRHEILAEIQSSGTGVENVGLLNRLIGDRVTNGRTAANIVQVLDADKKPSTFNGKTRPAQKARVKLNLATAPDLQKPEDIIGKVIILDYLTEYSESINTKDWFDFEDNLLFFGLNHERTGAGVATVYDASDFNLPLALINIQNLTAVQTSYTSEVEASFYFDRNDYQRWYGREYLGIDLIAESADTLTYTIPPLQVESVSLVGNELMVEAVPLMMSCRVINTENPRYLVFNDTSFTIQGPDTYDGEDYHYYKNPEDTRWQRLDTDVNPWQDEVFQEQDAGGNYYPLTFADTYSCSCPDFLHSVLRMPQELRPDGTEINRQRRAPAPSVQGLSSYEQLGLGTVASEAASWETKQYRTSHRMCKHSVSAHFYDKVKVQEPNDYPSYDARQSFEEKLEKDIKEVADEFLSQLERSEITTVEIVAVLGAALNYDEVQLASIILNSNF